MSSIWNEQVDRALKDEILKSIQIRKKDGGFTRLDEKAMTVRKPEEDFKTEIYPCVSYFEEEYSFDPMRYNPSPKVIARNKKAHLIQLEDSSVPFKLNYQVDFWAKYQTDMNEMTLSWLLKHFRQFNLELKDDNGNVKNCNVLLRTPIAKSDLVSGGERVFRTIFNYEIWVELNNENRYNVGMVTDIDIDAKVRIKAEVKR